MTIEKEIERQRIVNQRYSLCLMQDYLENDNYALYIGIKEPTIPLDIYRPCDGIGEELLERHRRQLLEEVKETKEKLTKLLEETE